MTAPGPKAAAESDLVVSQSILQATLESTADGLLLVDLEGRVVRYNRTFLDLWRMPDELVAARDNEALIAFAAEQVLDPASYLARVRDMVAHPQAETFDVLWLRDGRVFERYTRPYVVAGEIVGRTLSFRDVTKRVRPEENRFGAVIEFARDAVVTSDESGTIVGWNPAAHDAFGYHESEALGQPMTMLMPARYHARPWLKSGELGAASPTGDVGRVFQSHALRKDGTEFPCEISLNSWRAGTALRFTAFVRDVTERTRAEEALRMQARVLESMKECVVVLDDRHTICFANPALESTFGYARGELLGRHVRELESRSPEDHARALKEISEALTKNGWWTGECPNRRKDGSTFVSEVSITLLSLNDRTFFVCVQEDVTERRALQSKLVVSDRMASIGTLAAGVAHEINNPLAYVIANLEMLSEEVAGCSGMVPPETLRELQTMIDHARQGADRVRKIVRDLKAFSRADEDTPTVVDLRKAIDQAISLSHNEVRHRARLVTDFRDAPPVLADEARLCQVFVILLVNAAQALDEGQADKNEIRVLTGTDARGHAVVQVDDTGSGMTPETLNRIFDPFFTTKPVGQGTGLGLSICHGIVTKLGGEVTASSVPGKGTSFRVTLPPAPVERAVEAPRPAPPAPVAAKGRVLAVEDDVTVGEAVRRILREHEVTLVTNGRAALDLLTKGERYDVILCDLMMPEMTGMDFYGELQRALPDLTNRVVFMTGGAFTPASRAFLDRVANEVLEKPFDARNLRGIVARFVRR